MATIMSKREFKPRKRSTGLRDAKLIVIATEGTQTEPKYLNDLIANARYRNSKVHVEVLVRKETASSPIHIIRELDSFRREYKLNLGDELWLLIDVDQWGYRELSQVASQCVQKQYTLSASNPCFEIWLLLHLKALDTYSEAQLKTLAENKRSDGRTAIEKEIITLTGSYVKANLNTAHYIPQVETAIQRAKDLDSNPEQRWPNQIGTRVYLLIQSILKRP